MDFLYKNFAAITWQQVVMWLVGCILIWLAIRKNMEPALLLPMGFGAILVNIPFSGAIDGTVGGEPVAGILDWLFSVGIEAAEALPILLFIGIGAMIDFGPLLANPKLFIFGAAAQAGIFVTIIIAEALAGTGLAIFDFALEDSVSIGMIGAADGPTAILVAMVLKSGYLAPIMVAAYSYMALVPIVQPPVVKLITTKKERMIRMDYKPSQVSRATKIIFPIAVTLIAGLIAPMSVSLVGFLMFGNLIKECGVLNNLSETAQTAFANIITLLLGITIASTMKAAQFVDIKTVMIIVLGLFAFVFDTVFGVLCAKVMNLFSKNKINPIIGAAGISAFPMAARVAQKLALSEDPENHILMQAVGANVAGQIGSVVAGGAILSLVAMI